MERTGFKTKIIIFLLGLLQVLAIGWVKWVSSSQKETQKDLQAVDLKVGKLESSFDYIAKRLDSIDRKLDK